MTTRLPELWSEGCVRNCLADQKDIDRPRCHKDRELYSLRLSNEERSRHSDVRKQWPKQRRHCSVRCGFPYHWLLPKRRARFVQPCHQSYPGVRPSATPPSTSLKEQEPPLLLKKKFIFFFSNHKVMSAFAKSQRRKTDCSYPDPYATNVLPKICNKFTYPFLTDKASFKIFVQQKNYWHPSSVRNNKIKREALNL